MTTHNQYYIDLLIELEEQIRIHFESIKSFVDITNFDKAVKANIRIKEILEEIDKLV